MDGDDPDCVELCMDNDGDGYGSPASVLCDFPEADCDEGDSAVYPGAPGICDGKNNDCDDPSWPVIPPDEVDNDGDTLGECEGDCDDADSGNYEGNTEVCDDELDNDCDDDVDCDDEDCAGLPPCEGGEVTVTYFLSDTNGQSFFAFQLELGYDPANMSVDETNSSPVGVAAGSLHSVNTQQEGLVSFGAFDVGGYTCTAFPCDIAVIEFDYTGRKIALFPLPHRKNVRK